MKEKLTLEKIKGSDPNIAILNHDKAVNEKLVANLTFFHDLDWIKNIYAKYNCYY